MSRSKKLILGLIVFVVLCGALFLTTQSNKEKEEEPVESDEVIYIYQIPKEDIKDISLINEHGQLDFIKRDQWIIKGYEDYQIKAYLINSFENMFTNLKANRVITDITDDTDMNNYGLANPYATITATLQDGSIKTILLGNKTPDGSSYYAMTEEKSKVYTIASSYGTYAGYDVLDFRDDGVVNIDMTQFAYLYIDLKGQDTVEIKLNEDSEALSTHVMTKPYKEPRNIDSYDFEEFITNFPKVEIQKYVEDSPGDLTRYGLDDPQLELKIESIADQEGNSQEAHYLFGNTYEDEETKKEFIYFKPADVDKVYAMEAEGFIDKFKIKPFKYVDSLIYIVNILKVDKIQVQDMDKNYALTMKRETAKNEDGEEEVKETFFLNGKEVEDEAFRDIYQLVIGLSADFQVEGELELDDSQKVTLEYALEDGTDKVITYYPYPKDEQFYVTKIEDNIYFAVSKDKVKFMFEMLEAVDKGEWPIEE